MNPDCGPGQPSPPPCAPAPCGGATKLLWVLVALTGLATAVIVLDPGQPPWQIAPQPCRWMQALRLTSPAWGPAGSGLRHPETRHPAVDLRQSPGLEPLP